MREQACAVSVPGVLLLLFSACGEVSSGEASVDALPRFVLEEELRVGSTSDPAVGFTEIGGIVVDGSGLTYVLEAEDQHIRVYGADGNLLRTIGGPGQGPGEFEFRGANFRFGILGDTLWVNDVGAARFTRFHLDGTLIDAVQIAQAIAEVAPEVPLGLRPTQYVGGGEFISTYSIPGGAMSAIVSSPQPLRAPVVRMDRSGAVTDTVRYEILRGSSPQGVEVGGQRATVPQPPDERPLAVDTRDATFIVERAAASAASDAVISVRKLTNSDTVYSSRIRYVPKEWTPERLNGMLATSLRLWSNRAGPEADTAIAAAAIRNAMTLPPFQPPVSAVRLGDDEVLWLAREENSTVSPEWIMVGPDGGPVGLVTGPPRSTLYWSGNNTVWGTVLDELDVPWLVRFRVVPAN